MKESSYTIPAEVITDLLKTFKGKTVEEAIELVKKKGLKYRFADTPTEDDSDPYRVNFDVETDVITNVYLG